MPTPRNVAGTGSSHAVLATLPLVCIVTVDHEFLDVLTPELLPWFQVVVRDTYDDLTRWAREARVAAILLDIDGTILDLAPSPQQGEDPYGGVPVLTDLRLMNENLTLLSMSRAKRISVQKQAFAAGADARGV